MKEVTYRQHRLEDKYVIVLGRGVYWKIPIDAFAVYSTPKSFDKIRETAAEMKKIMLTKDGLCKRKKPEKVERTECTRFRKNGHNQSPFQNINVNL